MYLIILLRMRAKYEIQQQKSDTCMISAVFGLWFRSSKLVCLSLGWSSYSMFQLENEAFLASILRKYCQNLSLLILPMNSKILWMTSLHRSSGIFLNMEEYYHHILLTYMCISNNAGGKVPSESCTVCVLQVLLWYFAHTRRMHHREILLSSSMDADLTPALPFWSSTLQLMPSLNLTQLNTYSTTGRKPTRVIWWKAGEIKRQKTLKAYIRMHNSKRWSYGCKWEQLNLKLLMNPKAINRYWPSTDSETPCTSAGPMSWGMISAQPWWVLSHQWG